MPVISGLHCLAFLHHRQPISAVVVFDLVHDVVDEEDAAAAGFEEVFGVERVGDIFDVKALAFVFDGEAGFVF